MGAGVIAFLGGSLKAGIETVLDTVGFDENLNGADLVITGEGRVDSQSVKGKVVSGVARRAKAKGVPVVVLAGAIEPGAEALYELGVSAMFSINRKCEPFETARHQAKENLRAAVGNLLFLMAGHRG
jgi:glycerate kinase